MLTTDEIEQNLKLGYERREFEVKGAGLRTDKHLLSKIVKAALALGNLQDGGHIIVGIDDKQMPQMQPGLSPAELATWVDYDSVAVAMRTYSDPSLRIGLQEHTLSNGVKVVAIEVFEFADLPHLCAKGYETELREGALFIRPRGKPETTEVAGSVEMREVLELAFTKRLREFLVAIDRAGAALVPAGQNPPGPTDDELYLAERDTAWRNPSDVITKIQSRAHWWISVRPEEYQSDRQPHSLLDTNLAGAVVRSRGWPVPFIDDRVLPIHSENWIGQDIDAEMVSLYEGWRFFESGQLSLLRAVSADWREGTEVTKVPAGYEHAIEVWEILYYITEIVELAGRLSLVILRSRAMTITLGLHLGPKTALISGTHDFSMIPLAAPADLGERRRTEATEKLVTDYGPIAAELALEIFTRFGWNPTLQRLQILQRDLYR